jgi:hypothetical protein
VIASEDQFFGELSGDPTRWLNRLGALINDTNVEKLVRQLVVDVAPQFFVRG